VTEDRPLHVVLAGGGSAGHIEPALALADALRRRDPGSAITCLGTTKGLDTKIIPERGYPLELIPAVPMPRKPTMDVFTVPSRLAGTVRRTVEVLERVSADVVVGFGGYVSLPAYFAAHRRGVPMVVHEANVRPGLANRIGARMTDWIATGSPDCRLGAGRYLGMPLRQMI
jgi:UDP-N-acetylglucosamine--N-acetylmuramyl-(pentapeptide) pyrophosphoryl-undecaprenol N-acetylglucosamine transferase